MQSELSSARHLSVPVTASQDNRAPLNASLHPVTNFPSALKEPITYAPAALNPPTEEEQKRKYELLPQNIPSRDENLRDE